ncbi:MAG: signal peptidase II [Deferrisomatales bacterium]|nr:signal peptidase II [Deferrisomatales bacterium]
MRGRLGAFVGTAGAVLLLDQATKAWVVSALALYESVPVIPGVFHLTYLRNPGAAFGLFAGQAAAFRVPFFLAVTAAALLAIAVVARRLPPGRPWTLGALALVFGGAVGNLIDRVRWGEVVDFLDVFWRTYHWPAFNVADAAITVGVSLLILEELLGKRRTGKG